MKYTAKTLFPALLLLAGLAGCGGGGGGSQTPLPPPPQPSATWDQLIWDQGQWA